MKMSSKTAIIIGAGPAGLTAAFKLAKETDIHPIVLESSSEIGGLSCTVNYKGNRLDLGGHRFFSKNDNVMDFWKEIMPVQGMPAYDDKILGTVKTLMKGGPDPEISDRVMLVRRRVSRILYLRKFFQYPISMKPETFINLGLVRTVKGGLGYLHAVFFKRREVSLKDFMINRFGRPLYEMFFEKYTEKVWGRNPDNISASWGAQRIKGLSLAKTLTRILGKLIGSDNKKVETSLIDEFIYPKLGPGQLWSVLADDIRKLGGEIVLNAEVVSIKNSDGRINSVSASINGKLREFTGDYFLSSMPVKDLVCGFDGEPVPAEISKHAAELPYRDFITVGMLVKKLELVNHTKLKTIGDIVPDCWMYIQEDDVRIGRLQVFNNWSPYMVADLNNTVWLGLEYFCNENDKLWSMNDEEFIDMAKGELVKIGIISPEDVLDAVRIKVKKAYPAYFDSYQHFGVIRSYLDTWSNLYCIGRNGQHRYNNMDHSMLSAMEAVKCIRGESDKTAVWAVNAEEEYHEKKSSK